MLRKFWYQNSLPCAIRDTETRLMQPLLDYLSQKNSVRLLGPDTAQTRAPTIAIELSGSGEAAAAALSKHGIMAGGGDFYALRALQAQGIDPKKGVLRLSFVHYTSENEITALITALDQTIQAGK